MDHQITAAERKELASQLGLSEQYLYQCLTGRRDMDPKDAVRVERDSGQRLKRSQLRRDWREVWPELASQAGAA